MKTVYSVWIIAIMLLPAIAILQNRKETLPAAGQPYMLKGKIVDAQKGNAIAGVHLFVVEGEEEGFSNDKGEFKVKTWSKLPVVLVIKSPDYQARKISIKDPGEILNIRLTGK